MREFTEWIAYDRLEPIGAYRGDIRMAILATVIARSAGSKTAKPQDFMPEFDGGPKHQTAAQIMATFDRFAKDRIEHG